MDGNGRLDSLQELKNGIEIFHEVELDLYGVRYFFGKLPPNKQGNKYIVSWNDGDDEVWFDSVESLMEHEINGNLVKSIWKDIEIHHM